jgi:pyrrolidone-carboxylate peptidase
MQKIKSRRICLRFQKLAQDMCEMLKEKAPKWKMAVGQNAGKNK